MDSLQSSMGLTSLVCTILNFQLAMALAVESVADGNTDMAAVTAVIDTVVMNLVTYLGLMGAWTAANSMLFDIPKYKEEMTKQFAAPTDI
jgi:multisubunit Na+/H+ antiporter MnhF subunit